MARKKQENGTLLDIAREESASEFDETEWEGLTFNIREMLPLSEALAFVHSVVNDCFDGDTGEYLPEIHDFAIRNEIVTRYTDLDMPEDVSEKYEVLYGTGIVSFVYSNIATDQVDDIVYSIDARIDSQVHDNIASVKKEVEDTIAGLEKIEGGLSDMFGSISSEDIKEFSKLLSSDDLVQQMVHAAAIEYDKTDGDA